MILKLLVKTGPLAGRQFELKAGAIVGRGAVDIKLEDPKLSGKHAKIETDPAGNWLLTDLGSTNGIKVNGKRLAQVSLAAGLVIRLGSTDVEVISAPDPDMAKRTPPPLPKDPPTAVTASKETTGPIKLAPAPTTTAAPAPEISRVDLAPKEEPPPPTWSEYLSAFSIRAQKKVENQPAPLKPFDPLLVLSIIRGPQIGTSWVLGYGPRQVGIDSLDLPLLDANAPEIAFMITPKGPYALFETLHPKKVRLNNQSISSETLRADDKISIGDTVIHVGYRE